MKMLKIVVLEDDAISQEMILDSLSKDARFVVSVYREPGEFFKRGEACDLIISDWNFGHTTLEFFLPGMDKDKLVVLTGGVAVFNVNCLAMLNKLEHTERLPEIISRLPSLAHFFS